MDRCCAIRAVNKLVPYSICNAIQIRMSARIITPWASFAGVVHLCHRQIIVALFVVPILMTSSIQPYLSTTSPAKIGMYFLPTCQFPTANTAKHAMNGIVTLPVAANVPLLHCPPQIACRCAKSGVSVDNSVLMGLLSQTRIKL